MRHTWLFTLVFVMVPLSCFAAQAPSDEYGDVKREDLGAGPVPDGAYGDVTEEQAEAAERIEIADPLERWNRAIFLVNDRLYFRVFKPVAKGYSRVVPEDVRIVFRNFYHNLVSPIRVVNNLLQLKLKYAGKEMIRTVVNTTVGVGGLRDVAGDCFGVRGNDEDLGQTLGFYGAGFGFYLVWPVIGPSSVRDTVGFAGDLFLSPTWYLDQPFAATAGASVHGRVNELSFHLGEYESLKKAAVDHYVAMRSAYVQYREAAVAK